MALDSIHERVRQAVKAEIEDLDLPGITGVHVQSFPDENNAMMPAVLVTLEELAEEEGEASTFQHIHLVLPVNVLVCGKDPKDLQARGADYLGWRHAIADHFRDLVTLPDVSECWDVDVKPLKVVDADPKWFQFFASGLVVRAHVSKLRAG